MSHREGEDGEGGVKLLIFGGGCGTLTKNTENTE